MNKKGFTLIEILIVFAIIGTIIALSVSGLRSTQASQRDLSRKHIVSEINAQIDEWENVHNSIFPSQAQFSSSGAAYFINISGGCNKGISVNGNCISLEGLTYDQTYNTCAAIKPLSFSSKVLTLCYLDSAGDSGYTLGTYLEQSNQIYYAAK